MPALKTHISLNVNDLSQSVTFYKALFAQPPAKHKADYAKFDVATPSLNLALNQRPTPITTSLDQRLSHLGIQVENTAAVQAAIARFKAAGLATFEEQDTDCCYALQDKVWVTDPDGNRWEVFVVKVTDTDPKAEIAPVSCCG